MKLSEILRRRFLPVLTGLAALFLSVSEAAAQYAEADVLNDALLKASQSYADGDYNAVISQLDPLCEQYPGEGALWYYLGMSRLYRRDYEAGTRDLGKAVECDPRNYWYRYYYNLARVYYREDPAEGIAGYEELLRDYPARADLNYQLADIYMRSGRTDEGLALLDKIEELQGRDEVMTMYRYEILSSAGRDEEAVAALISFNEEYPSPRILNEIGTFYQAHDRDTLARDAFSAARALDPTDLTATLGLSETLVSLGEEDQWYELMRGVMADRATPASFSASYLQNQSNPYSRRVFKHPERIDTLADLALAAHPADTSLIRPAGLYFNSTGNTAKAREIFL
ncbi:MAG: tetratricopeptide repeat protein, partial [Bacteroidota bacterium]|nr:tetratricopeptide repeat protein [Bacteroidota bacterium]